MAVGNEDGAKKSAASIFANMDGEEVVAVVAVSLSFAPRLQVIYCCRSSSSGPQYFADCSPNAPPPTHSCGIY